MVGYSPSMASFTQALYLGQDYNPTFFHLPHANGLLKQRQIIPPHQRSQLKMIKINHLHHLF